MTTLFGTERDKMCTYRYNYRVLMKNPYFLSVSLNQLKIEISTQFFLFIQIFIEITNLGAGLLRLCTWHGRQANPSMMTVGGRGLMMVLPHALHT